MLFPSIFFFRNFILFTFLSCPLLAFIGIKQSVMFHWHLLFQTTLSSKSCHDPQHECTQHYYKNATLSINLSHLNETQHNDTHSITIRKYDTCDNDTRHNLILNAISSVIMLSIIMLSWLCSVSQFLLWWRMSFSWVSLRWVSDFYCYTECH